MLDEGGTRSCSLLYCDTKNAYPRKKNPSNYEGTRSCDQIVPSTRELIQIVHLVYDELNHDRS
jgi:hypothetical protein